MWQNCVKYSWFAQTSRHAELAPFLWRAKQTHCTCVWRWRSTDSHIVKIFSFKESRLFVVRSRSVVYKCIEILFKIVNGLVPNICTKRRICFGRCFKIIYLAYAVCFHNLQSRENDSSTCQISWIWTRSYQKTQENPFSCLL